MHNHHPSIARFFFLAIAVSAPALLSTSARAQVVPIPTDLTWGDQYRLIFLTTSTTDGISINIPDYNLIAAGDASAVAELNALGATWTALVSTAAVDARDNTGTDATAAGDTGVPIYLVNDTRLADHYDQLWLEPGYATLLTNPNIDETGSVVGGTVVRTGTTVGGVADMPLGSGNCTVGHNSQTDKDWIDTGFVNNNNFYPIYAISSVLTVAPAITNVTQATSHSTLQDALDSAVSGDAIEIAAGTLFEDGIVFPAGLEVTVTGAGKDITFIDGGTDGSDGEAILTINNGQTSATVISDLTLLNGADDIGPSEGSLKVNGTSPTFRDVAFRDATGIAGAVAGLRIQSSTSSFERCEFTGISLGRDAVHVSAGAPLFLQCLFADNATTYALTLRSSATTTLVNCTIDGSNNAIDANSASAVVTNSVAVGGLNEIGNSTFDRCLYAGATGNNIDGAPTYVDALGGDYRLAAGSLGIDAADSDAYEAAGGGLADLAGAGRASDDGDTADTGSGLVTFLDMGAYEFQGSSAAPCPADIDGSGTTNVTDLLLLLAGWGVCP